MRQFLKQYKLIHLFETLSRVLPCVLKTGKKEHGFTLIEIIIAVVIMGLAYVVILQSFSLSTRNISKVETVRNNLLQYALEFDKQSFDYRMGDEEAVELTEEVFMEGSRYQLVLVSDESESFMTLRLEKL